MTRSLPSDHDRTVLAGLADVLIPAGAGMPAASEAGVSGEWLDAVLAARPDLISPLMAILASADGVDPQRAVANLRASARPR